MIVTNDGKATWQYAENGNLDEVTLEAGEVIHYRGMPFRLKDKTVLLGRDENFSIAKDVA